MRTEGLSQKAAMMLSRQNPGQRGSGLDVVCLVVGAGVVVVVEEGGGFRVGGEPAGGVVMQQESSPGQVASVSISSQNSANRPFTHSPRHLLPTTCCGGGLAVAAVCGWDVVVVVVVV